MIAFTNRMILQISYVLYLTFFLQTLRAGIVTLSFVFALSAFAADHFEIGQGQGSNPALIQIDVDFLPTDGAEISNSDISRIVVEKTKLANSTVILTTDNVDLQQQVIIGSSINQDKITLVPLESLDSTDILSPKLAKLESPFFKLIKSYSSSAITAINNDKIGVLILTYTTSREILV